MKNSGRVLILGIVAVLLAMFIFFIATQSTWQSNPVATIRITTTPPVLPLPTGVPITNWNGVPVMPGAISGNGNNDGYAYTVGASPFTVQQFYETQMKTQGFDMFTNDQSTTKAILLLFTKDQDAISVSISIQPSGLTFVLLVK
jgi:hypothetical protein